MKAVLFNNVIVHNDFVFFFRQSDKYGTMKRKKEPTIMKIALIAHDRKNGNGAPC